MGENGGLMYFSALKSKKKYFFGGKSDVTLKKPGIFLYAFRNC